MRQGNVMVRQPKSSEGVNLDEGRILPNRLLLFDGECWLCSRLLQFVLKRDKRKRFYFAPLQSERGHMLKNRAHLPPGEDSMIYFRSGKCLSKSTAVLYVLRDLGGIWTFFFLLMAVPAPVRDAMYAFVARHRYRWFKARTSCPLPVEEKDRFLTS